MQEPKSHTAITIVNWAKRMLVMSEKELLQARSSEFCLNSEAGRLLSEGVTEDYAARCGDSADLSHAGLAVLAPAAGPSEAV